MTIAALSKEQLTETFQKNVAKLARHLTHLMFSAVQTRKEEQAQINPIVLLKEIYKITSGVQTELTDADRAVACAILTGYSTQLYDQTYSHVTDQKVYLAEFDVEFSAAELFDYVRTVYKFNDRMRFKRILDNFHSYGVIFHGKKYGDQDGNSFVRTVQIDPAFVAEYFRRYYNEIQNLG